LDALVEPPAHLRIGAGIARPAAQPGGQPGRFALGEVAIAELRAERERGVIAEAARHLDQAQRLDRHVVRAADALGRAGIEERAVAVAAELPLVGPGIVAVIGHYHVVVELAGDAVGEGERAHHARGRAGRVDGVARPTEIAAVRRRLAAAAVRGAALVPPGAGRPLRDRPRAARAGPARLEAIQERHPQ